MPTLYVIKHPTDTPPTYLTSGKRWGRLFQAKTYKSKHTAEQAAERIYQQLGGETTPRPTVVKTNNDDISVDHIKAITTDGYAPF